MQLIVAIVGLGALLYYQQAQHFLKAYHVTFLASKYNNSATVASSFKKIFFTVKIRINNPTQFAGTLKDAHLDIYYKGNVIGYINLKDPLTIAPGTPTIAEIPAQIPLSLLGNVKEMIQTILSGDSIEFNVKGKLLFSIGAYTISEKIKVGFKK